MTGLPWDESYREGPAPWEIGGAQPAVVRLADAEAFAGSVLDAGCGSGDNALHLAARGLSVVGFDVSATAVERARAKAKRLELEVEFDTADALDLAPLGRTFDTVLDCGLFHTFDSDERDRYALSLRSVTEVASRLYVLCFADRGTDLGPHPVSRDDIVAAFTPASGWSIDSIEPEQLATRFHEDGAPAWLATVTRMEPPRASGRDV
jgi:SAM-dependent methyltransferase